MATDVRKLAQDAAYVGVGVGVIAFQRAQVARREARTRIETQINDARGQLRGAREKLTTGVGEIRNRVEPLRSEVLSRIQPVTERLPQPLAKVVERGTGR